jgi:hypothetical protein
MTLAAVARSYLDVRSMLNPSPALYTVATGVEGSTKLDFVHKGAVIVKMPRSLVSRLVDPLCYAA